ncbi:hypothetical protein RhiJN_11582 [Ceratobasidium sp. AG-Ba]|nr:hypothetical protein RhiJN_11582 [Ceratobasidium sp. AG-Ba]
MFYKGLKDEIKMAMLSQLFNVQDNATTGQMVVNCALLMDQHLEQFSGWSIFETKNTSLSKDCTPGSANPTCKKLSTGDSVYMIGTDGRTVKGKIESIGRNTRGQVVPNVKWAGQNSTVQVPFLALKKDNQPTSGIRKKPRGKFAPVRQIGLVTSCNRPGCVIASNLRGLPMANRVNWGK